MAKRFQATYNAMEPKAQDDTRPLPGLVASASDHSVGTLVHDLRNSLATISNLVFYLDARLKAQPDTELQRAVAAAMGQVRHMSHLVDDLSNSGDRSGSS